MLKRLLMITLCCLMALSPALGEQTLRGYEKKAGWQYAQFGNYPTTREGEQQPLLWRVLQVQDDTVLMLTDSVVDARQAEASLDTFVDYEHATLNTWLLGDFMQAAFNKETEQAALHGATPLTLPTSEQMKDKALGFDKNKDRLTAATPYALSQGAEGRGNYWLSSVAGANRYSLRRIMNDGGIGYSAVTKVYGIRPLLTLSLPMLSVLSGSGTKEDPFLLAVTGEALQQQAEAKAQEEARLKQEEEEKAQKKAEEEAKIQAEKAAAEQALAEAQAALNKAKQAGEDTTRLQQAVETATLNLSLIGGMQVEGYPNLTREGFLPAGEKEFVFMDATNGVWRYCSQDLRIQITRHAETYEKNRPIRYLAAEIFVREGTEGFRMIPFNKDNRKVDRDLFKAKQNVIAQQNNVVFAMGGDYYLFRMNRKGLRVGVVIRDGEIFFDDGPAKPKNNYPPLHLMALYPDGDMRLFDFGETTAQQLVDAGARDVLSFGPWLIRDGQINMDYTTYGINFEPRVGIGMVEKGHYWATVVEGRIRPSRGMTCRETAYLLQKLGCVEAFNLDGGWTSSMIFMGQQLNQLDNSGIHNNARTQNEILGIGRTDNMAAYQGEEKK